MNKDSMGTQRIPSLLLEFSIPATAGMLINALYNIIDRIFIGNSSDLGAYGLAGITVAFPIMIIIMAVALMCGVGGATLFSINLGQKNYDQAKLVLGNSFSLATITAVIISIITYIFMDDILVSFGASDNVLPYAKAYLQIILLGGVFQGINMTGNNLIRADGSPKIAMLSILLGGIVHVALDPLFIYVFNWGMGGAAFATVLGQLISTIWIVYYYTKGKANYKLKLEYLILKKALAIKIILTGLPSFFIQTASSILNVVLNKTLLMHGGDVAMSAMGIVNSFQTLLFMPMIGINQGALPIIGFNYGAKKIDRIKEVLKYATIMNTAIALFGFIITRLFPEQIISMFNQDPELIEVGALIIKYWFLCLPIVGINLVLSNFFQAIGKVIPAIILTLTRQLLVLVPLIIILSKKIGFIGILYASPISDITSTILVITLFTITMKTITKEKDNSKQ